MIASRFAGLVPDRVALDDPGRAVRYGELPGLVDRAAAELARLEPGPVGLLAENGAAWVVADLAALAAGRTLVPLPTFFSGAQLAHVARAAGLSRVVTDDPARAAHDLDAARGDRREVAGLDALRLPGPDAGACRDAKVTFTSGTTGAPKGVRLSAGAQLAVARSLGAVLGAPDGERHLCVLPLSTLLENVGGVYRALLGGATVVLRPAAEVGFVDAASADGPRLLAALVAARAATAILVPGALAALVDAIEAAAVPGLPAARFVGVGGAPVPPDLLRRAARAGVPAYEGYGLSEASSVVALNAPGAARLGSVGRPLPHARVRVDATGEIRVRGALFAGYLGEPARARGDGSWATGDLGRLDADGFLHVRGRGTRELVTAMGRNVDPTWVERALRAEPAIASARVERGGNGLHARLVPAAGRERELPDAVTRVNAGLPAYARVIRFTVPDEVLP